MKCRKIRNIFKCFDLFAKPVTLRYSGQPEYESVTGGLCSIALVIVFISVFTGTLLNTLNKTYIYSTTTKSEDVDPTQFEIGTDKFMFALGLSGINMNDGQRWFDVVFQFRNYRNLTKSKTSIPLQRCTKEQWTNIDPSFLEFYQRLKLQQWLCPMSNFKLQLQGKYTSQVFKFYKLGLRKCNSALNPSRPCVSDAQIDAYLNSTQSFNLNFYFVNTILNPQSQQHISYYINDFNYFPFSTTTGCNTNIYVSSYNVTTDQSIYPMEDYRNETGGIVVTEAQMMNYEVRQTQYLKLNIRKSSLSLQVERSYRKLDDTVSYIGGLFSAIVSALILLGTYNQYSYELDIAQNLYRYQKNQSINANSFNIFFFIGYLAYAGLSKIGIHLPWEAARKNYKFYEKLEKFYYEFQQQRSKDLLTTEGCDNAVVKFTDYGTHPIRKDKSMLQVQPVKLNFSEFKTNLNKQGDTIKMEQINQKQKIKQIVDRMEDDDDDIFQQNQLNKNIRELKNCINVLKKECENGQKNSLKVFNCTNPKMINIISQIEESHTQQIQVDNKTQYDQKMENSIHRFGFFNKSQLNEKVKIGDKRIQQSSLNQTYTANNTNRANLNLINRNQPKMVQDIEEVQSQKIRRR